MKKLLNKIILVILISISIYSILTGIRLYNWSKENSFNIFNDKSLSNQVENLDESKIKGMGINVKTSIDQSINNGKDENYSIGFAVWRQTQYWLGQIFAWNLEISFIIGSAIVIGYLIINTNWNLLIKIFFGYFIQFVVFTMIYVFVMSDYIDNVKRDYGISNFFIIYTIVFIIMLFKHYCFKNKLNNKVE